jgi:methanogenic corrinoid protein MtbC1
MLRVSEATIKRWADEGLVACYRTPGGHRKFRSRDVSAFASAHDFELRRTSAANVPSRDEVLRTALAGDATRLFDTVLPAMGAGLPIERLLDEVLADALHEVGEQWACAELSVADEHIASATVIDVLSRLHPHVARPPRNGVAISACVPNERHDIAARMAAMVLASRGYRCLLTGADTPTDALLALIEQHHPRIVALSASITADRETVSHVLRQVASVVGRRTRLLAGGDGLTEGILPQGFVRVANMRALSATL